MPWQGYFSLQINFQILWHLYDVLFICLFAVQTEDYGLTRQYLSSWCRVNTYRRRRTLNSVADETGNSEMLRLLHKYNNTNELVISALACDGPKVKELLSLKSGMTGPQKVSNKRSKCFNSSQRMEGSWGIVSKISTLQLTQTFHLQFDILPSPKRDLGAMATCRNYQ